MVTLIDTHTHINCLEKITAEESVQNALDNNVEILLVPAATPEDIDIVPDLVKKFDNVYGMLGVHPEDAKNWDDAILDKIKQHVCHNDKIIATSKVVVKKKEI